MSKDPGAVQDILIRFAHGRIESLRGFVLNVKKGLTSQVFKHRSTIVVGSYARWPLRLEHPCLVDVESAVGVPIFFQNEPIACLGILHHVGGRPFHDSAITFLERCAEIASMVLEQTSLRQRPQRGLSSKKKTMASRRELRSRAGQNVRLEAVERTAQSVVHDFNNILTVLYAHAEMALSYTDNEEKKSQHLRKILWGCVQAKELLGHLRCSTKGVRSPHVPMDLAETVSQMFELIAPSLPANVQARKVIRISPAPISGVATEIQRVLVNLWTNARQAMEPHGGLLETIVEEIRVPSEKGASFAPLKPGRYVCVRIRDTGPGIPPTMLQRIFDRYFTTKKEKHGSGLGLSIVEKIVNSHGGYIQVESRVGYGTCFHVYFPALPSKYADAWTEEGETGASPKMEAGTLLAPPDSYVLVVDDDPSLREGLQEVLEGSGFRVRTAGSGMEALHIVQTGCDLIQLGFLDYYLPDMNGIQLAQNLRALECTAPLFILTGFEDRAVIKAKVEGLINDVLIKPVPTKVLLTTARNSLGANRGTHWRVG